MTACLSREAVKYSVERTHRKAHLSCLLSLQLHCLEGMFSNLIIGSLLWMLFTDPLCTPLGMLGLVHPLPLTLLPLARGHQKGSIDYTWFWLLPWASHWTPHLGVHGPHPLSPFKMEATSLPTLASSLGLWVLATGSISHPLLGPETWETVLDILLFLCSTS